MSATTKKAIAVIAGIGNGTGTRMNLSRVQSLLAPSMYSPNCLQVSARRLRKHFAHHLPEAG